MMNLLVALTAPIRSWLKATKIQRILAAILVGLVVMSTAVPAASANQHNQSFARSTQDILQDDDSDRPKTTGEWKAEARETEDAPGERAKRIVEESAEAVKDWAELYPDVAERSIPAVGDSNNS